MIEGKLNDQPLFFDQGPLCLPIPHSPSVSALSTGMPGSLKKAAAVMIKLPPARPFLI